MKLSMISRIIKDEVCVIHQRQTLSLMLVYYMYSKQKKTKNNANGTHENFMPS